MRKVFIIVGMCLFFQTLSHETLTNEQERHSAMTRRLVDMLNSNPKLRANLEKVFQKTCPKGYNFTIDDLYDFFDATLRPDSQDTSAAPSGYRILQKLGKTPEGKAVIRSKIIQAWFRDFLKARKEYLDSPRSLKTLPITLIKLKARGRSLDDYYIPKGGFTSYNDFFTRQLKPGKRPISDPQDDSMIVSPVDGIITKHAEASVFKEIVESKKLPVKNGVKLSIKKILMNSKSVDRFYRGMGVGFSLGTFDYHHYHSPVNGTIIEIGHPGGMIYFNRCSFEDYIQQGYRSYYIIETSNHGLVALIAFGASLVHSVNLTGNVGDVISKGDDLGFFAYGGSYVLLLFENPVVFTDYIPPKGEKSFKMGQRIGVFTDQGNPKKDKDVIKDTQGR